MAGIDLLNLFDRASAWTLGKVRGTTHKMDRQTPCDEWDVRNLLNHMLDTQRYFAGTGRGEEAEPPSRTPPRLLGDNPLKEFRRSRAELFCAFAEPGVIETTGPTLGIALADQLVHGWDVATATRQETTMPEDLADAAYQMILGRLTDDQRDGLFKTALTVPPDASPQAQLLAYTGRRA